MQHLLKKFVNGFTIGEIMAALGVMVAMAAALYPMLQNIMPDNNGIMAKKIYATAQSTLSETMNNSKCYPYKPDRIGLDDGKGYSQCPLWNDEAPDNAGKKFITLYTNKLDTMTPPEFEGDTAKFSTKDGVTWIASNLDEFNKPENKNNKRKYITISVDTNGTKVPNCGESEVYQKCNAAKKNYDIFTMRIYTTGKVVIEDCWAVSAVKVDKKLHANKEVVTYGTCINVSEEDDTPLATNASKDDTCDKNHVITSNNDPCCQRSDFMGKLECNTCYKKENNYKTPGCCQKFKSNPDLWEYTDNDRIECCLAGFSDFCETDESKVAKCAEVTIKNVSKACCREWLNNKKKYGVLEVEIEDACDAL